jgi:mono/diheme cytochrome c family protein
MPAIAAPVDLARGEALYGAYCASCHGANLEGQPD